MVSTECTSERMKRGPITLLEEGWSKRGKTRDMTIILLEIFSRFRPFYGQEVRRTGLISRSNLEFSKVLHNSKGVKLEVVNSTNLKENGGVNKIMVSSFSLVTRSLKLMNIKGFI